MPRYGFILDQDACIGCHACTVACKSEHDVPVGVNRTWVKYIETGAFPDTRRQFSVMRCNHCDDAPCITICPTTALFRRHDGIVDFDGDNCIGCKACMNACPYDALYIDPETQTAAKCNFCAHKVDVGLEPACVSVCPTQAIVAGDLDDPTTRISRMVGRASLQVRAPEQGTRPKVFYKGADQASLDPLASRIPADGMVWADVTPGHSTLPLLPSDGAGQGVASTSAKPVRTTYTTAHSMPWTWRVTSYLVTKGVGGGALMVAALLVALGHGDSWLVRLGTPVAAAALTALTGALLIADLKQPWRFWYMFTGRANWRSWLVKGSVALLVAGAAAVAWFAAGLAGSAPLAWLALPAALAGAAAAGYTAPLFAQCEGRDLWQTPLLLPALLAQAATGGAAALLLLALPLDPGDTATRVLDLTLAAGMAVAVALALVELASTGTANAEAAVRILARGPERARFWGSLALGAVAVLLAALGAGAVAAVVALVALWLYEHAFVRAGQLVPLS